MDKGAWQATVHRVTKRQTPLSNQHFHFHIYVCVYELSHFSSVKLFATPWTVACQAPLSMEFSSQEQQNGLQFPPLGGLSDTGMEYASPALADRFFTTEPPGNTPSLLYHL